MNIEVENELDKGSVVLSQDNAVSFLRACMDTAIEEDSFDPETIGSYVQEYMEYIKQIRKENWEWVLIEQCPMAFTEINIHKMVKE